MHLSKALLALVAACGATLPIARAQDVVIVVEDGAGVGQPTPSNASGGPSAPASMVPQTILTVDTPPALDCPACLETQRIEREIQRLRRSMPNLGRPTGLLVAGLLSSVGSLMLAALVDLSTCFEPGACEASPVTIGFGVTAAASFGVALGGLIALRRRLRQRVRIHRRIRELQRSLRPPPAW